MQLYKHQQRLADANPDKCGIFWEVGTGKSLMVLELLKKANEALIIVPKDLKDKWEDDTSHDIITKETFRRDWNKLPYYDGIGVDEFHHFLGMTGYNKGSAMMKALQKYLKKHKPRYFYGLTGTVYMSKPWNVYVACEFLGHKMNYKKFRDHFFEMKHYGGRYPIPEMKAPELIKDDIAKLVNQIGDVVKMSDCRDIPEQQHLVEYFNLTTEQTNGIQALEDSTPIVYYTKVHQICGGSLKGDVYTESQTFDCNKIARVLQLAYENKKLIIICRYNYEIEMLHTILHEYKTHIINGKVKNRPEVVLEADSSDACVVLIQSSCAEGYQLPSFPIIVYYSHDFSLKNYLQMNGRIQRIDNLKKNVYISLIIKNSIDEEVYKSLQNKVSFDVAIYNK